ncbi:MAG: protein kinase [Kofleriaceae bacterium]|nr:protein kinase [Kofleriaceae bacterium]
MHDRGSGAGWSDRGATGDDDHGERAASATDHPFLIAPATRYQHRELAGRGGMGEVLVARDRRLGRDVALKRIADDLGQRDPTLASRLAREAWVTARLEHPSIVPIYDAGVDGSGELYYTMRLIHGRSLAEALAEADAHAARLGLLRHFLAAAQAVAYAHRHGIVHRDLKPANIMVGEFGETQLVDWGLAGFCLAATARAFAEDVPGLDGARATAEARGQAAERPVAVTTGADEPVGTPAYMSPEQARGAAADPRGDVWALGAILHELLTGRALSTAASARAAADADTATRPARAALRGPGVAPELRAIVDKATALAAADRYPDAAALADDLTRYLDGRKVGAHDYTTVELARRLLRRLRLPLLVGASALLAASIALGLSVREITSKRARAVRAEATARRALDDSRQTSSWALARQAVTELAQGATAEAELLGAHALSRGESPEARGAVAAARAAGSPHRAETFELPGCQRVVAARWDLALCQGTSDLALWELAPTRRRWTRAIAARRLALTAGGDVLVVDGPDAIRVLAAATGADLQRHQVEVSSGVLDMVAPARAGQAIAVTEGRVVTMIDLASGQRGYVGRPCVSASVAALTSRDAGFLVVCGDGVVVAVEHGAEPRVVRQVPAMAAMTPVRAAASADGRWLLVGGVQGEVLTLDLTRDQVEPAVRVQLGAITELDFLGADPGLVVIGGDSGGARVWDLLAGNELLRLPAATGLGPVVAGPGLVTGGRRAGRWALAPAMRPRALTLPVGISAIAVDPAGPLLAIARSDGRLEVRDRRSGRVVHAAALGTAVVKAIDFAPDGQTLAASLSEAWTAPLEVEVATWARRTLQLEPPRSARRLVHTADGELFAAHWAAPATAWSRARVARPIDLPEILDLAASPSRDEVALLTIDGGLWRWNGGQARRLGVDPGATMIAGWPGLTRIATGHVTGVSVRAADGHTTWIPNPHGRLTDLALSPDQRYLVAGRSDGTIVVWRGDDYGLVAVLRGHRQRVASLAFTPDGLLYSAGWDGQVLTWDLSMLGAAPADLVDHAERTWATDLAVSLAPS